MLRSFLPFIVIGIATGSVYGLAGTGLVLTYKTSGIFNFAYGSLAALTVFVFYFLHTEHGMAVAAGRRRSACSCWPRWRASGSSCWARSSSRSGATLKVVATVGLLLIVLGIGTLWYGNSTSQLPRIPAAVDGTISWRRQRRLGPDHRGHRLGGRDRRPLLLLPVRPARRRHAGRGRQPRPGVDDRGEPGAGCAAGPGSSA